jgi:acyl-CoA reductase-like NAD-dependent aldehyde dehydrogenase
MNAVPSTQRMLPVRDPRSGQVDLQIVAATAVDVATAARRLRAAQPAWRALSAETRAAILARWADALEAAQDEIVAALSRDTGRLTVARGEVAGAIRNVRRWSREAPGLLQVGERDSALLPTVKLAGGLVPYPLVCVISPWNFPVTLSLIDAVPALAAGCAVLIKPSEVTPRFVAPLQKTLRTVPELEAVLQFVLGDGATGAALVDVADAVCFTGSVPNGRKVAEAAARRFIPAFLELGGKDPALVLQGADLERASDAVLRASCMATGQACLSIERVYVDRRIFDDFVVQLVDKASRISINHPDIAVGQLGPLIFARQADIIDAHLDDALAKGARILCGGKTLNLDGGRWCPATVVVDVDHRMALMTEETFGPIIPVMAVDNLDEAIALANDSAFGLSGAVFAATLDEARAVAARLNVGGISLNDAGLTYQTYEAEKNSFGFSGLGGSRMGPGSILRFVRKQAYLMQTGTPAKL